MPYICGGCNSLYKQYQHFAQHLDKTQKTACQSYRDYLRKSFNPVKGVYRKPPSPRMPAGQASDMNEPINTFEGDFYGNDYTDADFPMASDEDALRTASSQLNPSPMDLHEETDSESEDELGHDILSPLVPSGTNVPAMPAPDSADMDIDAPIPCPSTPDHAEETPFTAVNAHAHLCCPPDQVEKFPVPAGSPTPAGTRGNSFEAYQTKVPGSTEEIYAPFKSRMDWEVARWAKLRGSGSTAFSDLLKIPGVTEKLGLSYHNSQELNTIIDNSIPSQRPKFTHREVKIAGESFDIFSRDIIECIRALYSDPEHAQYLCFAPERHYTDVDKTERLYHDMHTGKWWWDTQISIEAQKPGATIIPVIISSDKTQLTLFRNKSAYPVYLTIGNLPKTIRRKPSRRGQILLAYLPTTNLSHIKNKSSRRRALSNLFHACMQYILSPLETAGADGIVLRSGDGVARRCHPIFACFVGDYPEQCLVTGTFYGQCPICLCPHDELGDYPCEHPFRSMDDARDALKHRDERNFAQICKESQLRPVRKPFWESLPFVNVYASITPDILHQLHQGVMKHLISWLSTVCGEEEFDERVKRLPPNHGMRVFHKGVTSLSRVSGTEHKQIASFLLGILIDIPLKINLRVVRDRLMRATRSLLDFLYIAQYSVHSDATLVLLDQALFDFHENKSVFVTLEAREDFLIPKLHSLTHYSRAIRLFGTTDNYSTESTERLHIDFAKDAYAATNHKDEYPQMTRWLERREKILFHEKFILWRISHQNRDAVQHKSPGTWEPPDMNQPLCYRMTKHPTRKVVHFSSLTSPSGYNAPYFAASLARYFVLLKNPTASSRELTESASRFTIPFNEVAVFHKMKFTRSPEERETLDSIHVDPGKPGISDTAVAPRFDMALVRVQPKAQQDAMQDLRVGQVRVLFSLPPSARPFLPAGISPSAHLAYIEWFTPLPRRPEQNSRLYRISRTTDQASIVPVANIERSIHLFPKWGGLVPREWTSCSVLDDCDTFFVNPYKDHHTYFNFAQA